MLLGQFGDWGAYKANPGGKEVCFALAKPTAAVTEPAGRNRDPSYAFISTRPSEKVRNEVSVIVGYPQKAGIDATATIDGSTKYAMYTQDDGAWVKNAAEEAQMVSAHAQGRQARGHQRIRARHQDHRHLFAQGRRRGARQGGGGVQVTPRRPRESGDPYAVPSR